MKKGVFAVLLAASIWASLPIFGSMLYAKGVDALSASAMRAYIAAIIYLILTIRLKPIKRFNKSDLLHFAITGLLSVTGTYSFYLMAIERLNVATAAILLYTAPAFVTLFSKLLYKEPITRRKALALLLTFIGCFFVVRAYDINSLKLNALGILFGVLSGLCYAMFTVLGSRKMAQYGSQLNCTYITVIGSLFFIFIRPPWVIPVPDFSAVLIYIALALFGTVLPYLLYMRALQTGLNGSDASIIATIEPVVVALLGVFFLHQNLGFPQVFGIVLTLLGACLSALNHSDSTPAKNH